MTAKAAQAIDFIMCRFGPNRLKFSWDKAWVSYLVQNGTRNSLVTSPAYIASHAILPVVWRTPVLAKSKTIAGRLWTYVRDDQPFGRPEPPVAMFYYSRDRRGKHPNRHLAGYAGILQADAYAGFNDLYHPGRKPGPVTEAGCWAHGRRKLFDLAKVASAPLAAKAVRRIDAIFDAERSINGLPAEQRPALRQTHIAPLVAGLETWMRGARGKMSRHAEVAKAMGYMLKRWARSASSSATDAFASATMPPSARCAAQPSGASRGCSAGPVAAATAPRPCTRSSPSRQS